MAKIKVSYMAKEHELEVIVPGVVQKGNAYLVQCARSGEWCYCSPERMEKLKTKYGSIENVGTQYFSRDARALNKKELLAKQAAEAKAKAATEAAKTPTAAPAAGPAPTTGAANPPADGKNKGGKKS